MSSPNQLANFLKRPGAIILAERSSQASSFEVECHTEDDEAWYAYDLDHPYDGLKRYAKRFYDLVGDGRADI